MAGMTYRQLLGHLQVMDEQQLNSDVTIHLMPDDEYYGYTDIDFSPDDDVLDKNHPFINVDMTGGDKKSEAKELEHKRDKLMYYTIFHFFGFLLSFLSSVRFLIADSIIIGILCMLGAAICLTSIFLLMNRGDKINKELKRLEGLPEN